MPVNCLEADSFALFQVPRHEVSELFLIALSQIGEHQAMFLVRAGAAHNTGNRQRRKTDNILFLAVNDTQDTFFIGYMLNFTVELPVLHSQSA